MPRSGRNSSRGGVSRGGVSGRFGTNSTPTRRPHSTLAIPGGTTGSRASMGSGMGSNANTSRGMGMGMGMGTGTNAKKETVNSNSVPNGNAQPGMFSQMASTAAGVAMGSTVGHVIGAGITGLFGGGNRDANDQQLDNANTGNYNVDTYNMNGYNDREDGPCSGIKAQFTDCLQTNQDSLQCNQFWEMFKKCQESTISRDY